MPTNRTTLGVLILLALGSSTMSAQAIPQDRGDAVPIRSPACTGRCNMALVRCQDHICGTGTDRRTDACYEQCRLSYVDCYSACPVGTDRGEGRSRRRHR